MKQKIVALTVIALLASVDSATAANDLQQPNLVAPATYSNSDVVFPQAPVEVTPVDDQQDNATIVQPPAYTNYQNTLENDSPYNNDFGPACDGACYSDSCDCCSSKPCTLSSMLGLDCCAIEFGGWMQMGYHTSETRLGATSNDGRSFNNVPDNLNLQQAWLFAGKKACGANGLDWGFRVDMLYGTDAQKTQAFGNKNAGTPGSGSWDASLDNGQYGWAMPQAYVELAVGDFSVIAGHFFTIAGYEGVAAPNNFFYSHSLTMFNSEPFTHTGVLTKYTGTDGVTLYSGWTLGWDTGFDQNTKGSSFLGGISLDLTDSMTFTYITSFGNLGARSAGQNAYSHSMVLDVELSDRLNYVLQSDLVSYSPVAGATPFGGNDQVGINQYLFYTLNDKVSVGGRFEWWKTDGTSLCEITGGMNIRLADNIVIRPEVRYDWTPSDSSVNAAMIGAGAPAGFGYNQTTFGIDGYITF